MKTVMIEKKFRVPLNAQQKPLGGRFNRFDDAVRRHGAGVQRRGHVLHRLMMRTVHTRSSGLDDPPEEALWSDLHRMAQLCRRRRLSVLQRMRSLRVDVLVGAAAERHIQRLHAAADTEQRHICGPSQLCHLQLKGGTPLAHDPELIPLALAIQFRSEVRSAPRQQKAIDLGK